jgi:hypothetical protein
LAVFVLLWLVALGIVPIPGILRALAAAVMKVVEVRRMFTRSSLTRLKVDPTLPLLVLLPPPPPTTPGGTITGIWNPPSKSYDSKTSNGAFFTYFSSSSLIASISLRDFSPPLPVIEGTIISGIQLLCCFNLVCWRRMRLSMASIVVVPAASSSI